jgi:hypothetical protein
MDHAPANQAPEANAKARSLNQASPIGEPVDPIVALLLREEAATLSEAEGLYLDRNLHRIVELVESPLSDEEFGAHPLIALLLSHGSRDWEDSLL